jgi:hydrogenase maturation protease
MSRDPSCRWLVAGCGNDLAGDDALGMTLLSRLAANPRADCLYVPLSGSALAVLDLFGLADSMLVLDAVFSGSPAGTIHLLPLPGAAVTRRDPGSAHGWSILEAARLAAALGRPVPPIVLLGIEASSVGWGDRISDPVLQAIDACVLHFDAILRLAAPAREAPHRLYGSIVTPPAGGVRS